MRSQLNEAIVAAYDLLEAPRPLNRDALAHEVLELRTLALGEAMRAQLGADFKEFAHEVRDPFALIDMNLALLEPALRLDAAAELDGIVRCVRTGLEQVQSLLDTTMGQTSSSRPMSLNAAVRRALSLFEARGAQLTVHAELSEVPDIAAIGQEPTQVLVNLLNNAADAAPGGQAWVRTSAKGDGARLELRDDGCGMTEEVQSRLFERGFTTKLEGLEAGLGMAITRAIIDRHHATIGVESAPGAGTRIWVDWPRA